MATNAYNQNDFPKHVFCLGGILKKIAKKKSDFRVLLLCVATSVSGIWLLVLTLLVQDNQYGVIWLKIKKFYSKRQNLHIFPP